MTTTTTTIGRALRRFADYLPRRRRWQAGVILLLMLAGALAELMTIGAILPFLALIGNPQAAHSYPYLGTVFGYLGWNDPSRLLIPATILFAVIAVLAAIVRIVLTWASQKFVFRLGHDLSVAVYEGILYQPYSFHVMQNSSEILAGIGKIQQVITSVLLPIMLALTSVIIALFIFGGLLALNAGVALASAAGFGIIYFAVAATTRQRLRRNSVRIAQSSTQRVKTVQEGLGGIRDVLIDHAQPMYLEQFNRQDTILRDAQAANALIAAAPRFVVEGAGMILIAGLALVLSKQAGGIAGALPVLGALALGAQRLLPLLQLTYNAWAQVMGSRQILFDVLTLLDRRKGLYIAPRGHVPPLPFRNGIELKNLSFRYRSEGPDVLQDVSLSIAKGARVAFIGKTGSGKSTIMDLIMGLLDPTEGEICVDGTPLSQRRAAWQSQIAHVPQAIYLSDASIAENIAFGVQVGDIDPERIRIAAQKADIHDFIETLPEGYHTPVGERGIRLSGGQRQRIGIARALYKQSKVLIFDEATSALDDTTEAAIMAAIDRLGRDLTVLMIAHRLSTVRNCDIIYRFAHGRVEASGTFEEVVRMAKPVSAKA